MGDNLNPGGMDVFVRLHEMGSNNCSEKLRRRDGMLLGHDVDGILHGVCRYDNAVVCFCVSILSQVKVLCNIPRYLRGFDITFEEHAYCHLHHCLNPRLFIFVDLVDPDVVFAILGCGNLRHNSFFGGWGWGIREIRKIISFGVWEMLWISFFGFEFSSV